MNLERKRTSNSNYVVMGSILAFLMSQVNYMIGLILVSICIIILTVINKKIVLAFSLTPLVIIFIVGIINAFLNVNDLKLFNVMRDTSYFIRPIIIIYFGYVLSFYHSSKDDINIYKFIVICSVLGASMNLLNIIINIQSVATNFSFLNIRKVMGYSDDIMVLGFIVLIFYKKYYDKHLFSDRISRLFLGILTTNILISFSRTRILSFCLMAIWFTLIGPRKKFKANTIIMSFFGTLFIAIIVLLMYGSMAQYFSFIDPFVDKITHSLTEISAQSDWNDYTEIVHNWRGYEIYSAEYLMSSFTRVTKIFGAGFGTLIPVSHSDLVGVPLSDGGIILLHNGYYTMLIKTGVLGVAAYIIFFGLLIIKGIKCIHKNGFFSAILIAICIDILMNSYTTTGIFKSIYSFEMLITLGYVIWRVEHESNK